MEFLTTIQAFLVEWSQSILAIVGGFAVLATKTPNKVDDKILQVIVNLVNFIGMNVDKAANAEQPE